MPPLKITDSNFYSIFSNGWRVSFENHEKEESYEKNVHCHNDDYGLLEHERGYEMVKIGNESAGDSQKSHSR